MSRIPGFSVAGAPVKIGEDAAEFLDILEQVGPHSSLHLICDEHTVRLCLPRMPKLATASHAPIVIPTGEQFKSLKTSEKVWNALAQQGADRHSIVISLGGGVVTDLGGFCAATYMRGIRFVHIPTTLLGMCDAAIGGKQGVDLGDLKNYVGVFAQPEMVWVDVGFLGTLPERHLRNGMAEVVKHGIIGDPELFDQLEAAGQVGIDAMDWEKIVLQAMQVKKHFVEADEFEQGVRAALNFGHTIGHAIESHGLANKWQILHGECVALGMMLETWISHLHFGYPDSNTCERLCAVIKQWTQAQIQRAIDFDDLIPYLVKDKKAKRGIVHFALIQRIGEPRVGQQIALDDIRSVINSSDLPEDLSWLTP